MQRYFIPEQNWNEDKVTITANNAHHIIRVMRNKVNDLIICNHPNGQAAICTISSVLKDNVQAEITEWLETNAELPINVTIAQALPKGNKLELTLQKGTELGAVHFSLVQADRSVSKWDSKKSAQKIARYEKILTEASEQCHRNLVPTIDEPMTIDAILNDDKAYDYVLYAYEEEAKNNVYSSLSVALSKISPSEKLLIFIGPEGGFSGREVELLKGRNCIPVRLGRRILRTETASMYALASISYHFEELRCNPQ